MFVKNLEACDEITANDGCLLRELLHPANDPVHLPCSIAVARVGKNARTYKHTLTHAEVYFILSGTGKMYINDEVQDIGRDDVVLIPPGSVQWLENTGNSDIRFMAIVSPPWTKECDVRID